MQRSFLDMVHLQVHRRGSGAAPSIGSASRAWRQAHVLDEPSRGFHASDADRLLQLGQAR
ncbi:hypothetical protein DXT57_02550 [Stenotrophomonas maltophilia]|nr:hypothetical protein DXT57_02550 [Stenotrophomonas maltophilia]